MRESDGEPKNNPGSFVPFCHTARPHAPCPRCVPVTRHVQDSTCCPHPQLHSNNNEEQRHIRGLGWFFLDTINIVLEDTKPRSGARRGWG
jgi:hypothetical protein